MTGDERRPGGPPTGSRATPATGRYPAHPPLTQPTLGRRLLTGLLAVTSALVLVISVGGYIAVEWFNGTVGRIHLSLGNGRPEASSGSQNWLLVGTDSRAGTGSQYGGTALVTGQRSDTTIVAHLDASGLTTLMSIPRDMLVTIPSYLDASGRAHPPRPDKFNSAINDGGPSLIVRTVEQVTGLRIDHYAGVDLAGFKQISSAVGGVAVCQLAYQGPADRGLDDTGHPYTSTNLDDSFSGWHGRVGVQTVEGDQALAFVRQRHGLPRGDLDRIARQQQFLRAVFRKATSSGVLTDPVRLASLMNATKGALTLDDNTSVTDLEDLARRLKGVDPSRLRFVTVPTTTLHRGDPGVFTDGAGVLEYTPAGGRSVGSVQLPDRPALAALVQTLAGSPPPGPAQPAATAPPPVTASPAPSVSPAMASHVRVAVQNATGRSGLAREVSGQLHALGFRTLAPGTHSNDASATRLLYPPDLFSAARTLAAAVPGAQLSPGPALAGYVELVLGTGFHGLRTAQSSPAAAGGAPPTTPPAPASAASLGTQCTY